MAAVNLNHPKGDGTIARRRSSTSLSLNLESLISTEHATTPRRLRLSEQEDLNASPRNSYSPHSKDVTRFSVIKIRERAEIRNRLRNLLDCLGDARFSSLNLIYHNNEFFLSQKEDSFESVADQILILTRLMLDHEIKSFIDDNGLYVSQKAFHSWVLLAFHKNATKNQFIQLELLRIHIFTAHSDTLKRFGCSELIKLPLPDSMQDLSEVEKRVVQMLMRLYPLKNTEERNHLAVVNPKTFLATYPNFISNEELFKLIKQLMGLNENEIPLIQKIRLLNLCRTWISSGMFSRHYSSNELLTLIQDVITKALDLHHPMMTELGYELSTMMHDIVIMNSIKDGKEKIYTVDHLSEDLRILSIRYFLDIEPSESIVKDKNGIEKLAKHFNKLGKIVKKLISENPNHGFDFFLDVAYQLYLNRDYQSAITIFVSLSSISARSCFKWQALSDIANTDRRFSAVRKKIAEHLQNGEDCVPFIEVLLNDIQIMKDGNQDMAGEELNMEKLDLLSKSIWQVAAFQKRLYQYWNDLPKPVKLHTNFRLLDV